MSVDETSEMPTRVGHGRSIKLDILRGWSDRPDPTLRSEHGLPPVARLVASKGAATRTVIEFHGPDIYFGRFHPQAGPVDIVPTQLADHEIYKFAAPHARFIQDDGDWVIVPTAPNGIVRLNARRLSETGKRHQIRDGDKVELGVVEFVFETGPASYDEWFSAQKAMLSASPGPTLFLKRAGAIAGPSFVLNGRRKNTVGRRFPEPATVGADWPDAEQPDWNLSGLWDHETKFIGFRHVELSCIDDEWSVTPVSLRQRTYLNRVEIVGETPLLPGDEIGLGSVLLHFHHPANIDASTDHRTAELPAVVDWNREHTRPELEPLPSENELDESGAATRIPEDSDPDSEDQQDDQSERQSVPGDSSETRSDSTPGANRNATGETGKTGETSETGAQGPDTDPHDIDLFGEGHD